MREQKPQSKVRANIRWGVLGILGLFVVAAVFDAPSYANRTIDRVNDTTGIGLPHVPERPFRLGLDLQGGTQLVYEANVANIPVTDRGQAVEGVRDVIDRRVNGLGVGEPNIETSKVGDSYRLIVELPGVTDVKTAIAMIGETPILEFKEEDHTPPRALTKDEKEQLLKENAAAKVRAEDVLKKIVGGGDFAGLAKEHSDNTLEKNNGGSMGFIDKSFGELYAWAAKATPGVVSKTLIQTSEGYNIAKRGGEREGALQVRASHILICYLGAKGCDAATMTKEEAKKKAEELFAKANAANFAALAKENSTDPGSKINGGDLGFFGKGTMVPAFDTVVFSAKTGEIVGPVESEFGFHIIYKTAEERPKEYEVSRILVKTKRESDIVPQNQAQWKATGLSGKQLSRAEVVTNPQTGVVQVSLAFNSEGKDLFRDITSRNIGKQVAIFLDGQPISVPRVNQAIPDGRAVITGQFDLAEARLLAQRLNAGALPVPVELISQQSLGASLGAASLSQSVKAGLIGILLVILFMMLYYRLPGVVAALALVLYISLTLALFKLFGITLTLAGIAGFIMSVGLAVDANVLIFERTKEELRSGKRLGSAVEEGFLRAWPSIRDSNISTIITAAILIWLGSSFVKGFALTLALGVLMSMFSAITVSRILLRFIAPWLPEYGNWLVLGSVHQQVSTSASQQAMTNQHGQNGK